MRFQSLSLAVMMGCVVAVPLAFAQNDSAKPTTTEKSKMADKQHTAGVPGADS